MSTKPSPEQPIENPEKWREDFPVDIPQDQFVSRREFIKFLLLISGIFAAGQLGMGLLTKLQTFQKNSALSNASIPIASTSELAVGESKIFRAFPVLSWASTRYDECVKAPVQAAMTAFDSQKGSAASAKYSGRGAQ